MCRPARPALPLAGVRRDKPAAPAILHPQEEIAEAVGMPEGSVTDLSLRIRKYEIPGISGQFAEDMEGKSEKQQRPNLALVISF